MNQLYVQQNMPQQVPTGVSYYGNMGMQPAMYGGMAMNMAGNQMRMPGVNMLSNGVTPVNLGSNAMMMNRGMMTTGSVNVQQAGMVGSNQTYGRVMQFK